MTHSPLHIAGLALLPPLGSFAGAVAADFLPSSRRRLNLALHVAVGSLLALIGMELMPEALKEQNVWTVVAAFMAGGIFFIFMDKSLHILEKRMQEPLAGLTQPSIMILLGAVIDLTADGIMLGASLHIAMSLTLFLVMSQALADLPLGFALISHLRKSGLKRRARLGLVALTAFPVLAATFLSYWFLWRSPAGVQFAILTFTAGILLAISVEEMIREAHQQKESAWETVCLLGGFSLIVIVSEIVG